MLAVPVAHAAETGSAWAQLTAQEQQALQPLEGLWSTIGPDRRLKWREVAARFPTLSADERNRIRERMVDWAKLSQSERAAARIGFEQAKTVPPEKRQAGWEAYRALPEDQRKALATQATQAAQRSTQPVLANPSAAMKPEAKSNIVAPTPAQARPVTAAVVQATVGASTRPINQVPPKPPEHHQPGQPKIAASPEFVNRTTLLPQRPTPHADTAASRP